MADEAQPDPGRAMAHKVAQGAGWLIAWRSISRMLGLISTLVLTRLLVPADFGLIGMATTFVAAVEQMSQLGLGDALVRQSAAGTGLFDVAWSLQLLRAAVTALVLAILAPAAVWWFHEPRLLPMLLVLAASVAIGGLENIGIAEFRRQLQFNIEFRLLSVPRLLQVAVTVTAAILLRSYWALMAGILAGKIARTVMTYRVSPYRPRLRLAGWRELAGFSFWTWATTIAGLVWDRCDPFVLGPAVGPARLGLYLLAFELAFLPVTELIAPASEALFAGFASAQHTGSRSLRLAPRVASMLLLATLPVVIGISAASGHMVAALLGPRWVAAQPLVAILAWMCLFSPLSYVTNVSLTANGLVRLNFVVSVLASIFKLAALVVAVHFTQRLASIGLVSVSCIAAESLLFLYLLGRTGEASLRPEAGGVARMACAGGVTAGAVWLSGLGWHTTHESSLGGFAWSGIIGFMALSIYGAALVGIWFLSGRPEGPERSIAAAAQPTAARAAAAAAGLLAGARNAVRTGRIARPSVKLTGGPSC